MASIRFGVSGNEPYSDHKQLNNIGKYEHAIIDQFINELENARANDLSLGDRLDKIEEVNEEQNVTLGGIDDIRKDLTDIGISVEELKKLLQSGNLNIDELKKLVAKHTTDITALNDLIVKVNKELSKAISDVAKEVKDARLSTEGILYPTLKDRLDAIQYSGGGGSGGGGSGGVISLPSYFIEHVEIEKEMVSMIILTQGVYVVGVHELDVFLNGILQRIASDYVEVSPKEIKLIAHASVGDMITLRVRDRSNPLFTNTIISETLTAVSGVARYKTKAMFNTTDRFLEVYYNGQLLIENRDYTKSGNYDIQLTFAPVQGSSILCQVIDTTATIGAKQLLEWQQVITGKKVYHIKTYTVTSSDKAFEVYLDGVHCENGADYTLTDTSEVTFTRPVYDGSTILFSTENSKGKMISQYKFDELVARVDLLESKIGEGGNSGSGVNSSCGVETFHIGKTDWTRNSTGYKYLIEHNKDSKNIIVGAIDTVQMSNIIVSYTVVDSNSVLIEYSEDIDCEVTVVLSSKIFSKDFVSLDIDSSELIEESSWLCYVWEHNKNTKNVLVSAIDATTGESVITSYKVVDSNTIVLLFGNKVTLHVTILI